MTEKKHSLTEQVCPIKLGTKRHFKSLVINYLWGVLVRKDHNPKSMR